MFRTALDENNRGHAALQLGQLHGTEGNHAKALACFRWVSISGLAKRDPRFFVVHFNIGVLRALMRDQERSLASFRRLLDLYPDRLPEILTLFAESDPLQQTIESQDGFAEKLLATCPELFGGPSPVGGSTPVEPPNESDSDKEAGDE